MKALVRFILKKIFALLPLQDKVVFRNFNGKGLGDDPKYIALELLQSYPKIKLIWLASDVNTPHPPQIKVVKFKSIFAYYHMATAKVWVNNIKHSSMFLKKRKGQFYIQTWHAPFGVKRIEADANLSEDYIKRAKLDAAQTDLMYANNDFRINLYKTKFWYSGEVIKSDSPRLSILFQIQEQTIEAIRKKLQIPTNCGIVLYAPTFRANSRFDISTFDFLKIINALTSKYNKNFVMLLRFHPNDIPKYRNLSLPENVINASNYPDMQELLAITDILITDFSSCMFDFTVTQKPIFLYAKDFDEYISNERDLYFSIRDLPFPVSKTDEELVQTISNFDTDLYTKKVRDFLDLYGISDSGQGAKNIATLIYNKIKAS